MRGGVLLRRLAQILAAVVTASVAAASPFGVNAHLPSEAVLEQLAAAGVGWIRIDVDWDVLEPAQDEFNWALFDRVVDGAERRGMRIFATLSYTPAWATSGSPRTGVPDDPADWQDVCYRAAARYRGRVAAWGLWNEPNLSTFWQGSRRQYIDEILIPGASAVRAADPAVLVAGPDLAHLSSGDWDVWLREVLAAASASLDVVTHHAYPSDRSASDVTRKLHDGGDYPWDAPSVRSVLQAAGWWGRPFWLTETGLRSTDWGELAQADFVTSLLRTWFAPDRSRSWVDRIFIYQAADDPRSPLQSFGILHPPPGLQRKRAHDALRSFVVASVVDDAEVAATGVPAFLEPEEAVGVWVAVRNTGTTTWRAADGHQLAVDLDPGRMVRSIAPLAADVPPGGLGVFAVDLVAPSRPPYPVGEPRPFRIDWRMDLAGRWRFGQTHSTVVVVAYDDPPRITGHPAAVVAADGTRVVFEVETASATEATFRWQRNGVDLEEGGLHVGADTPMLEVIVDGFVTTGEYRCAVTNAAGRVWSDPARLDLTNATTPPRRPAGAAGRGLPRTIHQ